MKVLFLLVLTVLMVALAIFALIDAIKRSQMFFPERYPIGEWNRNDLAVRPRDEMIVTRDAIKLHGWYFAANETDAPLIIWFHGNAGNLSSRAGYAAEFARRGISTLLFDYRGYGKSEGQPTEEGLLVDSLAAYDYALRRIKQDPGGIVLYGESLGGPFAAHVAANREACCVIVENSFPSLSAVAREIYPHLPFLPLLVSKSLTTADSLNKAGVPVLIMHGLLDEVVPYHLGRKLYEQLSVEKEMMTSEQAHHSEIPRTEGNRYYEIVARFIRNHRRSTRE